MAGALPFCSSLLVQTRQPDQRWQSRSVDSKVATFHPTCSRLSRQVLQPYGYFSGLDSPRRRIPLAWNASLKEEAQSLDTSKPEEVEGALAKAETEAFGGGRDVSWLPALPHVITAAVANVMFGYHIGVMNGPLKSVAEELNFAGNTLLEGFVVSIFLVGAFVGSITGGILSDTIGRRRTLQICSIPLIAGAVLSATAQSVDVMLAGRLLVGVGIGVNTSLVPLYISEIAPTKFRGALGSCCQLGTCVGIIAALLLGIPSEADPHWWRTMFWIATFPAGFLIAGMQFAVESPRWLGKVGRWQQAELTVKSLWGEENAEDAMKELRNVNSSKEEESSWAELLSPRYFKIVGIGGALFALQQFAGINGVLYFSSLNFKDAGITDGIAASALVGVFNLIGALFATSLLDTQGRKKLLIGSYSGMAISLAMMVSALAIPMDAQLSHALTVSGTLAYVVTFALGAGPVTGIIIPEMASTRIRAKAMAVSLCVHWVCNFGIGLLFLSLVREFGLPAIYSTFGVVSILSILFTQKFIIETKGRSLEEIEILLNNEAI